jgi:hypothetical protein
MTPEQRFLMYGSESDSVSLPDPEDTELALSNAGGGMIKIAHDGKEAIIPTLAYTRALEKRIAVLERDLKNANNNTRKIQMALNSVIRSLSQIDVRIDSKLDRPFE